MDALVCKNKNCGKVMAEVQALDDKGNFALESGAAEQMQTRNGDKVFVCPHCGAEHPLISERGAGGVLRLRLLPPKERVHEYKGYTFRVHPFRITSGDWVLEVFFEEHNGKTVRGMTYETPRISARTEDEAVRLGLPLVHAWIDRQG